jgi:hypothetical protein
MEWQRLITIDRDIRTLFVPSPLLPAALVQRRTKVSATREYGEYVEVGGVNWAYRPTREGTPWK